MKFTQDEVAFVSNLSQALKEQTSKGARLIIFFSLVGVVWFVVWAYFAKLDEVTRGMGQVIPSSKVQMIQNLEGGIVEEILVKEGDEVKENQPLLKLKNQGFESTFKESKIHLLELKLQAIRLKAQLENKPFVVDKNISAKWQDLVEVQKGLYGLSMEFLENQQKIISSQIAQKKSQLNESRVKISHLRKKLSLVKKQIAITKPLVESRVESETNFLTLQRDRAQITQEISVTSSSLKGIQSAIKELEQKQKEFKISFDIKTQKELNDVLLKIAGLEEKQEDFADKVTRTLVRSPTKGIVKLLHVNTIGGVVKPGMDLVDVVPLEDSLLIEAKIKPVDIAFIHPGQKATVKVTAYDFSIYGGLEGEVVRISADTLKDEKNQTYFLVEIKTKKTDLGTAQKPMKIIPGMIVSVDILTGKKSILSYLLKPLLKAKQNALTER